jgi:hypothetical protein
MAGKTHVEVLAANGVNLFSSDRDNGSQGMGVMSIPKDHLPAGPVYLLLKDGRDRCDSLSVQIHR